MSFGTFRTDVLSLDSSDVVAAIVRAVDGLEVDSLDDDHARIYFGCPRDTLPKVRPAVVNIRAGARGGKTTRLLAPKCLHAAWTTPCHTLAPREEAYAILVAPTRSLAMQAFTACRGLVESSPILSVAVVGKITTDSLVLRRPDGLRVRIKVLAAGRGGAQLRGKTLLFAGFDEAAFFRDKTGAINDEELFRAVSPRVVASGQVWFVSTPWIAGVGLMEQLFGENWGTHENALCVQAPTGALFPAWDPTGKIEARERKQDPDNAEREIDAVPLPSTSSTFFSWEAIDAAVVHRALQLPYDPEAVYGAGADLGLKRDASALAIVSHKVEQRMGPAGKLVDVDYFRCALVDELRPRKGAPLTVPGVLSHFKPSLATYEIGTLAADSHEREHATTEAQLHNVNVIPLPEGQSGKAVTYAEFRKLLHEGRIELPDHPRLIRQLKMIVAKPSPGGGITITSPRLTSAIGGHGDIASALVGATWVAQAGMAVVNVPMPETLSVGRLGTW